MKKMINQPLVSVIMPVYNAGEFLVEAIESILKQTYRNFELLIVDDGSTDNSWNMIKKYKKMYPKKIRIYHLAKQTNYAGNGAVNYGLQFAKGEFIVRMDADDVSLPQRLEKQVDFMLHNPKVILLGTQAQVIDKKGKFLGNKIVPVTHKNIYDQYGVIHPIIHPSCMLRRALLPNPNKIYESKFGVNSDYYSFFRLLNHGEFANLPDFLLKYRVHEGNFSLQNPKKKFVNSLKIRLSAIADFNYQISLRSSLLMILQTMIILPLPEKLIVPLYMVSRGMSNSNGLIGKFKTSLQLVARRTYSGVLSLLI